MTWPRKSSSSSSANCHRSSGGAFRAWLRQVAVNQIQSFHKARRRRPLARADQETDRLLAQLEDPNSDLARQWDRDHDKHVFEKLLALVRADFEPRTWQAFTRLAPDGQPAARG